MGKYFLNFLKQRTMLKRIYLLGFCLSLFCANLMSQDCMNRPAFNGFNEAETEAILDYICGDIVDYHVDNMGVAHGPQFLQWHREYLEGLEDYLLAEGFDDLVPLPAWNPCSEVPWMPNIPGPLTTCPEQPAMPDGLEGESYDCGNFATDRYSCENLCDFDSLTFFKNALQADHDAVHNVFGETTFNTPASPGVVLFWPWHAYVDDIYLKYQAATLDPALPMTIELVEQNCCEVVFKAPKYCCSTVSWGMNSKKGGFNETWFEDNYWYMSGNVNSWPFYQVYITYTGTCGTSRTVGVSYPSPAEIIPYMPSAPPLEMQNICMDDFEPTCRDFGNIPCLETMEVTTSSSKLIAEVNGTELCLSYIHPSPYTGTITITPIGTCGNGEPVTWTIYANQSDDCFDFGDGGWWPRLAEEQARINVFPNPFSNELNINCEGLDKDKKYSVELLDVLGRVVKKSNQVQHTFSTTQLDAGIYLIRVVDAQNDVLFLDKYIKQ